MGRSLPYDPELQGRRQPRQLSPRSAQGGRDIHPQRVLQILLNGTEQSIDCNTLIYIFVLSIKTTKQTLTLQLSI